MRRLALLLLALAACTRAPAPPPAAEVFRDASAPIWSNASFDAQRLSGTWRQVAGFGADCAPGAVRFEGGRISGSLCLDGEERRFDGPITTAGPARLLPAGESQPWWILWIDIDERSMAIGTPSGAFGFVLDRTGAIPADRLKAAAEILDWNGYDMARFRRL
ncbi:lipocalin family protein [Falsirhodobacter algicola]|uniref:Lipocalin n=1 Tax=Falsirhodobacter algicola TaxID=2692330 RepID=A0A8J8MQW4_9RHOB|nr:lipocalin family protein [Falsirhodobacter algicola]QUS34792.1 lipocalin [Falsirhodobacter algicola]